MRYSFRLALLVLLSLALLVAGCASRAPGAAEGTRTSRGLVPPAAPTLAPAATMAPMAAYGAPALDAIQPEALALAYEAERKIIRTATLQLRVQETEKTVATIKDLVQAQGGYVANASVWREGALQRAYLSVRVPADRMEAVLAQVRKLAVQVEREETGGQDVTEEFVDLEAQLRNLEAAEKELRELLATVREKTGKAEDVMAVYRELTNIRGQIDRLRGRQQYLTRMTEMATINLQLYERGAEPISQPGWQPLQTLRNALSALVKICKGLVDLAIWGVALSPLVIVPALLLWALWRLARRRRAAPKADQDGWKKEG